MTTQSFTQTEAQLMYKALVRIKDLKTNDLVKYCGKVDDIALDAVIAVDRSKEDRAKNAGMIRPMNCGTHAYFKSVIDTKLAAEKIDSSDREASIAALKPCVLGGTLVKAYRVIYCGEAIAW